MLFLLAVTSGCSASTPLQPETQQVELPVQTTHTPRSTPTTSPTATPTALARATPTSMPSHTPTPTPLGCWQEGGRIALESLRSDKLRLPMEVRVYLPPCYDEETERRYAVLYLLHGQNYNDQQWDDLGADEAANRLIADGEAPSFLIIMPRDRLWKDPPETPFDEVFIEELLPWVDQNYRTLPGREQRAIGGLSRGGAWAVHFGLSHWELFSAIGAHSAPIFWSDTRHLRDWLKTIPEDRLPRLYFDIGEKDYLSRSNRWMIGVLDEMDIPHEYYLFTGYHDDQYWSAHVEAYLRWYSAGW